MLFSKRQMILAAAMAAMFAMSSSAQAGTLSASDQLSTAKILIATAESPAPRAHAGLATGTMLALAEGCVKHESQQVCAAGRSKTCISITDCKNPVNNVPETCTDCK